MEATTEPTPKKRAIWTRSLAMRWMLATMAAWVVPWGVTLFFTRDADFVAGISFVYPPVNLFLVFFSSALLAYFQSIALFKTWRPNWVWVLGTFLPALLLTHFFYTIERSAAEMMLGMFEGAGMIEASEADVVLGGGLGMATLLVTGLVQAVFLKRMGVWGWWKWPIGLVLSYLAAAVLFGILAALLIGSAIRIGIPYPVVAFALVLTMSLGCQAVFGMFSGGILQMLHDRNKDLATVEPVPWKAMRLLCGILLVLSIILSSLPRSAEKMSLFPGILAPLNGTAGPDL